jgi:regulator of sirC expression with transglutaminase-like and TPR domain
MVSVRASEESRQALEALAARVGDDLPLDRTLLLIAKEEYPQLEIDRYLEALDRWGARARHLEAECGDTAQALRQTLFLEGSFRGNSDNYYDPRNSMLNEVIDRRIGIPITLSIVYLEVAKRAGARAVGVGFPGHFLVRHEVGSRSILIDPFAKGAIAHRADCERLLKSASGEERELEPWMLAPSSPRSIVIRVLTNLKHAYMLQKDYANAVRAIDRMLIFDPELWPDRRDRGLMMAELGFVGAAIHDLEAYIEHCGPAQDGDQIRRVLPVLKKKLTLLN